LSLFLVIYVNKRICHFHCFVNRYQFLIRGVVAVGHVGCAKHIFPVVSHGPVGEVWPVVTKNGFVRVPIVPIITNYGAVLKAR